MTRKRKKIIYSYALWGSDNENRKGRRTMRQSTHAVPLWEKYLLTIPEAAKYYGIGPKILYEIIKENPTADYLTKVGTRYKIKRVKFEEYMASCKEL